MQQTANYNLNLPEGTDVVNPLVDYNPNFSTIDVAMKANADRTVGRATCIKSGTTHVVTRSNTGSNIINFTATGDWNAGDTMTIDSTIVSVFLPDGTSALDGAYLINSEVFGILNGTRFTLYSNAVDIPEQSAANTSYDNTGSGLSANNVQDAIDEVDALAKGKTKLLKREETLGFTNGKRAFTPPFSIEKLVSAYAIDGNYRPVVINVDSTYIYLTIVGSTFTGDVMMRFIYTA